MALSSERKKSTVDPSKGIYVEMEGVMEVRYSSEDVDDQPPPEDFFHFQSRLTDIPDDFCHKNKQTTIQAYFFCLVCDCDLKSIKSLKDHIVGNKHIRKACEKKRIILDLPMEPKNAPRIKKLKRPQPRVDINKSLKERLEDSAQPALGLDFIEEYRNPNDRTAHRMYSCKLDGCKSAWGNSDDMYNHVIKYKHTKNFLKMTYGDDSFILSLSNAEVLAKAAELDSEEERDYHVIKVIKDYEQYIALRDRPDDWSERKAKLGLVGKSANSNLEPLGSGKMRRLGRASSGNDQSGSGRRSSGWEGDLRQKLSRRSSEKPSANQDYENGREDRRRIEEESPFNTKSNWCEEWKDWEPPSQIFLERRWMKSTERCIQFIMEEAEEYEGHSRDKEYEEAMEFIRQQRFFINNDPESPWAPPPEFADEFWPWQKEMNIRLNKAAEIINEKTDGQEKELKHITKLLAEVEDEIIRYQASRDSRKYKNIQSRLKEITRELASLKPTSDYTKLRKDDLNRRVGVLWKKFEDNSDDKTISSILESQMKDNYQAGSSRREKRDKEGKNKPRGERTKESRKIAVDAYREEILEFIRNFLDAYQYPPHNKIAETRELDMLAKRIADTVVEKEIHQYGKEEGRRWEDFHVNAGTKNACEKYIAKKMEKYVTGSIFNN